MKQFFLGHQNSVSVSANSAASSASIQVPVEGMAHFLPETGPVGAMDPKREGQPTKAQSSAIKSVVVNALIDYRKPNLAVKRRPILAFGVLPGTREI